MAIGRKSALWIAALSVIGVAGFGLKMMSAAPGGVDKLTYHGDAMRSGWNDRETKLTPARVRSRDFGIVWQSPQLDSFGKVPPRLFATPLYVHALDLPRHDGAVAFLASTAGYAYAIAASASPGTPAGTILWRRRLTAAPCGEGTIGNLSTPVIDRARQRLYVTACTGADWTWHVHALDLRSGEEISGWPVEISPATMDKPGINRNGTTRYSAGEVYLQRGALNLGRDARRLYVAFGPDTQGWLVSIDTDAPGIASAFSSNPVQEQQQGGMWGSSGPSVDRAGRIYISTGASFAYTLANRGIPGVFPGSAHSWGQSILQFVDDRRTGLRLTGSYTPYNYCQTAASDIDIGGSGAILFDLPAGTSGTRNLLALGGGKQGNAYLLDRENMPGGITRRHPCSTDPASDRSLLASTIQPELRSRGPVNVFGPFSDNIGMTNQAKSRSTMAHFRDARGRDHLFVSGSSKTGADFSTNVPPGLVRLEVVAAKGKPAYLRVATREMKQTFANPGSPFVSSNGGKDAIVWLLDPNAPRSADLFAPDAPHSRLYAFDAMTLDLLWSSGDTLFPTGKYNEPTVVDGLVLVGTDRLQALGTGARPAAPRTQTLAATRVRAPDADGQGKAVFQSRCSGCHAAGLGGAPNVGTLAGMDRGAIVAALTTGKMKPMATGLDQNQIDAVSAYLKRAAPRR